MFKVNAWRLEKSEANNKKLWEIKQEYQILSKTF